MLEFKRFPKIGKIKTFEGSLLSTGKKTALLKNATRLSSINDNHK